MICHVSVSLIRRRRRICSLDWCKNSLTFFVFKVLLKTVMEEVYDVIVLGTGLKVESCGFL